MTLLFFGYTYCPDVCPIHMANIAAVKKKLPPDVASRLKVVFVTTDPERDTPERITQWLSHFDRSFIGLTGTLEEVNEIQRAIGLGHWVIRSGVSLPKVEFTLQSAGGDSFDFRKETDGFVTLLFFGYTFCPTTPGPRTRVRSERARACPTPVHRPMSQP